MNKNKAKKIVLISLASLVLVGGSLTVISTSKNGLLKAAAEVNHDEHCQWNHYSERAATPTRAGVKEYWHCCTHYGDPVFTQPGVGDITDQGVSTRDFDPTDSRYLARTKIAESITSPVAPEGTALDADKFTGGKNAIKLSAVATGDAAKGTSFTFKQTFDGADALEFDFRVFSQKGYTEANPEATTTHDYTTDKTHAMQSASLYTSDYFNPYMDLKEISITMTSVKDPTKWVKCYVHGGSVGRADLSTARVYTSADVGLCVPFGWTDCPAAGKEILYGYGVQCDTAWPYLSWLPEVCGTRYTELTGSFSNNTVDGTTSQSSKIKFDTSNNASYDFSGWCGYYRNIRDCVGNWNCNESGYGYQNMAGGAFSDGGYKVTITFEDITSNSAVAGDISSVASWGSYGYKDVSNQYAQFSTAYDRVANMVLYSVNKNGSPITLTADMFE